MQRAVLGTFGVMGAMSVAAVMPNVLQLLPYFDKNFHRKSNPKYAASGVFWKLVDGGYIVIRHTTRGKVAELTSKGRKVLSVIDQPNFHLKRPRRWDKKWRVLIFDIKEKKRATRNLLRSTLSHIGFVQLQQSVWVCPYDCEDLITLLKADYRIGTEVLYMIVDRMENDQWLRENFSLGSKQ